MALSARLLRDAPTMAEVNARPHATPKHELSTKLDRAIAKKAADHEDERQLAKWAADVKDRDGWKDQYTGQRVKKTRALDPLRAEAHHIEPRENYDVRYDVRNGITLSFATHDAVERNKLRIVGIRFFRKNGKRYIDATHGVKFVEVA